MARTGDSPIDYLKIHRTRRFRCEENNVKLMRMQPPNYHRLHHIRHKVTRQTMVVCMPVVSERDMGGGLLGGTGGKGVGGRAIMPAQNAAEKKVTKR